MKKCISSFKIECESSLSTSTMSSPTSSNSSNLHTENIYVDEEDSYFRSTTNCICNDIISYKKLGLTYLGCDIQTNFISSTILPTQYMDNKNKIEIENWELRAYRSKGCIRSYEPVALIYGNVKNKKNVYTRVHDQCMTSEVFGSLKCDCKLQFENAKSLIRENKNGIIIYLPQEGRGIGLANKIQAYNLQENGQDTVDANRLLGFDDDYRIYDSVAHILKDLNIHSIDLITNNPRKIQIITDLNIKINRRIPSIVPLTESSQEYMKTKINRMKHMLPIPTNNPNHIIQNTIKNATDENFIAKKKTKIIQFDNIFFGYFIGIIMILCTLLLRWLFYVFMIFI